MNAPLDAGQRASLEAALSSVTLDDKYTLERGRAYMSGIQALVRLPMLQQERDQRHGDACHRRGDEEHESELNDRAGLPSGCGANNSADGSQV